MRPYPAVTIRQVSGRTMPDLLLVRHHAALLTEVSPRIPVLHDQYVNWLVGAAASPGECVHWVAEIEGRLVASLGLVRWSWPPSHHPGARGAFVYGLYVEHGFRRLGMASRLLAAARAWAKAERLDHLSLLVSPLAGDLYATHGYRPVSRGLLLRFVLIGLWLVCTRRLVQVSTEVG